MMKKIVAIVLTISVMLFLIGAGLRCLQIRSRGAESGKRKTGKEIAEKNEPGPQNSTFGPDGNEAMDAAPPVPGPANTAAIDEFSLEVALMEQTIAAAGKAENELRIKQREEERRRLAENEDAIYRVQPKYEDMAPEIKKEALALLAEKMISAEDKEAVMELVRRELDDFWKEGGLSSPEAYRHGYLARAMMDELIGKSGGSFAALDMLKETVSTANILFFADGKNNEYATGLLLDIAGRQKELIDRGAQPLNPDAFYAILDWTNLVARKSERKEDSLPGWKWLLDNSAAGGWSPLDPILKKAAEETGKGKLVGFFPYEWKNVGDREYDREDLRRCRRLPSFKGSTPEIRSARMNLWETPGKRVRWHRAKISPAAADAAATAGAVDEIVE